MAAASFKDFSTIGRTDMNDLKIIDQRHAPEMAKHVTLFTAKTFNDKTPLPSMQALQSMRREVELLLHPVGDDGAVTLAKMLFGSYPRAKVDDPKIYLRSIVSVLADAPKDIAVKAVDEITKHRKFIPNRAEVFEVVDAMVSRRKGQKAMIMAMMREQERRAEIEANDAEIEAGKKEFQAKYAGKTGEQIVREAAAKLNMSANPLSSNEENHATDSNPDQG